MMIEGEVTTLKTFPVYKVKSNPLKSILEEVVGDNFIFLNQNFGNGNI